MDGQACRVPESADGRIKPIALTHVLNDDLGFLARFVELLDMDDTFSTGGGAEGGERRPLSCSPLASGAVGHTHCCSTTSLQVPTAPVLFTRASTVYEPGAGIDTTVEIDSTDED